MTVWAFVKDGSALSNMPRFFGSKDNIVYHPKVNDAILPIQLDNKTVWNRRLASKDHYRYESDDHILGIDTWSHYYEFTAAESEFARWLLLHPHPSDWVFLRTDHVIGTILNDAAQAQLLHWYYDACSADINGKKYDGDNPYPSDFAVFKKLSSTEKLKQLYVVRDDYNSLKNAVYKKVTFLSSGTPVSASFLDLP